MTEHSPAFGSKEKVRAYLENQIRSGELSFGSKLPSERELGATFRLGRPAVREVLRGLADQGYIEVHVGRGSFVRAPDVQDLTRPLARVAANAGVSARDIVGARLVLETAAARQAAEHADASQKAAIADAFERHMRAETIEEIVETDLAFHTLVSEASGNPVLAIMFGSIAPLVRGVMLRSQSDVAVHEAGEPTHRLLLQCIFSADADGAEDAMRQHIALALELYGDDLDAPLAEVLERLSATV